MRSPCNWYVTRKAKSDAYCGSLISANPSGIHAQSLARLRACQQLACFSCLRAEYRVSSLWPPPSTKTPSQSTKLLRNLHASCFVIRMTESGDEQCAYFWMPSDHPYGAFSHWYVAETKDKLGNVYPTMEHYMMYQKAILFGDERIATEILSLKTPKDVKEAGRRVHGFDKDKWKAYREQIVVAGNLLKFTQHKNLQMLLLETGSKLLVEASPEDRTWGIGYSATDAPQHRNDWGENLCGHAIQKVRAKFEQ